jgi:hypothetical protein
MTNWETLSGNPNTYIKQWIMTPADDSSSTPVLSDLTFSPAVIPGTTPVSVLYASIDLQTAAGLERAASQAIAGQKIDLPEHEYLEYDYPHLCKFLKSAAIQAQTGFLLASRKDHLNSGVTEMNLYIYDHRPDSYLPDSAMYYSIDQGIYLGCDYWLGTRPTIFYHTISSNPANTPPYIPPMFEYNKLLYPNNPG